jgi:hypothetical protein
MSTLLNDSKPFDFEAIAFRCFSERERIVSIVKAFKFPRPWIIMSSFAFSPRPPKYAGANRVTARDFS